MQIENTTEILRAVQPEDERLFLRWLICKIDQVVNFPAVMPYCIESRFGHLKIDSADNIFINSVKIKRQ